MIFRGWVITYLWAWFIVPFGIEQISLPHAIGISIMTGLLTFHRSLSEMKKAKEMTTEDKIADLVTAFFMPTFGLLAGWIINFFM